MRQAHVAVLTVALAQAARCVHGVVHRFHDLCNVDCRRAAGQTIPASGAPHALYQLAAAQLGKQLLEVGDGDTLAQGYICQRDRPLVLMEGQIQHRCDRVAALGGQTHMTPVSGFFMTRTMQYPTVLVKYWAWL